MQTFTYDELSLYCGADFNFHFRLKYAEEALHPPDIIFTASSDIGGRRILHKSLSENPDDVAVDETGLITIHITAAETALIRNPTLYYQLDIRTEEGEIQRWITGTILLHKDATHV